MVMPQTFDHLMAMQLIRDETKLLHYPRGLKAGSSQFQAMHLATPITTNNSKLIIFSDTLLETSHACSSKSSVNSVG